MTKFYKYPAGGTVYVKFHGGKYTHIEVHGNVYSVHVDAAPITRFFGVEEIPAKEYYQVVSEMIRRIK